jgi:hypothetical protein
MVPVDKPEHKPDPHIQRTEELGNQPQPHSRQQPLVSHPLHTIAISFSKLRLPKNPMADGGRQGCGNP